MSDSDKQKFESSVSNTSCVVNTKSYDKLPKKSGSQSITINLYPSANPAHKSDKLIQTEHVLNSISNQEEIPVIKDLSCSAFQEKETSSATLHYSQPRKLECQYSPFCEKKLIYLESDEKKKKKPKEYHTQEMDRSNKAPTNKQSDLERRRLEAELKAAEEIAKLRQTIIEKRLALELATIDDGAELPKMSLGHRPSLQAELHALEEMAMRKQSLIETNLAQKFETVDYQRCRSSNPPSPSPPPARPSSPLSQKQGPFKTDSSSSIMIPIRNIGILDKKLNADRKFSCDSGQRSPTPTQAVYPQQYMDPRMRKDERYYRPTMNPAYQYKRMQEPGRTYSAWKSAVAKIKNKIRHKSSDGWDQ